MSIAYLTIQTFAWTVADATHYYGNLCYEMNGERVKEEVTITLTKESAKRLNRNDRYPSYEAGCTTFRMESQQDVIMQGIRLFQEKIKMGILILGDHVIADPQRILCAYAPYDTIVEPANAIYRQIEKLHDDGGWDKHGREMNELCDQWERLIDGHTTPLDWEGG